MATHSSVLAWKIPWTEDPGGLLSMGSLRVGTTEQLHFHFSLSCIGEGNGHLLHLSGPDLGHGLDGVHAAVLGQRHGDDLQCVGEGAHGILLQGRALRGHRVTSAYLTAPPAALWGHYRMTPLDRLTQDESSEQAVT